MSRDVSEMLNGFQKGWDINIGNKSRRRYKHEIIPVITGLTKNFRISTSVREKLVLLLT